MIATVLFLAYFTFILYTSRKFKCQNFYQLYCEAVGKPMGTFFVILFAAALFLTLVESASVEANSMHTNMLLDTPTWMFALFFVIPAIYTVAITLPYLADIKDNKRLLKHSLIGLLIVAQMEVIATTGVMMSFDINT